MSDLHIRREGRAGQITLDRAHALNALSYEMCLEIDAALRCWAEVDAVALVVIDAIGDKAFCAGGDLGWMREQMAADRATRIREATKLAEMLLALDRLPKPLIGRVQGNAFGGGVGLAAVCDVAIGAEGVKMGLTETRLGIIPATIGPYVVARMGAAKARRVFMSARVFGAAEAERLDLLARVVPEADLDAAVEREVAPYLSCAPGAVAAAKALIRDVSTPPDAAMIRTTIEALADRWETAEADEGTAAFFAKRAPDWAPEG